MKDKNYSFRFSSPTKMRINITMFGKLSINLSSAVGMYIFEQSTSTRKRYSQLKILHYNPLSTVIYNITSDHSMSSYIGC